MDGSQPRMQRTAFGPLDCTTAAWHAGLGGGGGGEGLPVCQIQAMPGACWRVHAFVHHAQRLRQGGARAPGCAQHGECPSLPDALPPLHHTHAHCCRYTGYGTAALMAFFICYGPDTTLQAWARPIAEKVRVPSMQQPAARGVPACSRCGQRLGALFRMPVTEGSRHLCMMALCCMPGCTIWQLRGCRWCSRP